MLGNAVGSGMPGLDSPDSPEDALGLPGEGIDGLGMEGDDAGLGMEGAEDGLDEGLDDGLDAGDDGDDGEPDELLGGAGMEGVWGCMLGDLHAASASSKPIPVSLIIVETIVVPCLAYFLNLNYSVRNLKYC